IRACIAVFNFECRRDNSKTGSVIPTAHGDGGMADGKDRKVESYIKERIRFKRRNASKKNEN
ncbi:MAG: hypothetical protein KDK27_20975, partial [Leptospiraceae bacterium]|nr:hypothetical protein [Leptospiraceae bacterium]